MSTQPQSKLISLIEELNEIRRKGGADSFTLRRIKNEAGKLQPLGNHIALGIVAVVEDDPGEMRRHFKISQDISPDNWEVRYNFATSLRNLGFYLEARDVMRDLHDFLKGNADFLESYVINFYVTGRFSSALRIIGEMKSLHPAKPFSNEERIAKIAKFIEDNDISEDQVEAQEQVIEKFLQEKKIYGWLVEYELLTDEESTTLVGDVLLWNTIEETIKLRMELGRRMAELEVPENVLNAIHFHLKSRETLENGDYADRSIHLL